MKKTPHKNVTLSLPEPLLKQFRVYAAQQDRSMTSLMAEAIEEKMSTGPDRDAIRQSFVKRMRNSPNRGTKGVITWTREEIHERR